MGKLIKYTGAALFFTSAVGIAAGVVLAVHFFFQTRVTSYYGMFSGIAAILLSIPLMVGFGLYKAIAGAKLAGLGFGTILLFWGTRQLAQNLLRRSYLWVYSYSWVEVLGLILCGLWLVLICILPEKWFRNSA